MSRYKETQTALDARLASGSFTGSPPIAWENKEYKPVEGQTYLRPTNLPSGASSVGLADDSSVLVSGFYQIDVFAPRGKGPGPALGLADEICQLFSRVRLTNGNTTVALGVPAQQPAIPGGAWNRVSVLVPYQTLTN